MACSSPRASPSHGQLLVGARVDDPQVHERDRDALHRAQVGQLGVVLRSPSVDLMRPVVATGLVSVIPQACRIGSPICSR